jgi:hypothetical protein
VRGTVLVVIYILFSRSYKGRTRENALQSSFVSKLSFGIRERVSIRHLSFLRELRVHWLHVGRLAMEAEGVTD